ncbi:hypothetical protein CTAYLR_003238 [Chrysophaeum taylorii]|uniref:PDZ domain-containing protein n=1 Tax=Chrysophaeum taylorii TaxID=2483200 RepID=A0AAD7UAK3_9STRA|nr:hypothetical protein CTAYLR_003238 [Chrysophaeum taylorii]
MAAVLLASATAFVLVPQSHHRPSVVTNGIFDGVKDAFSQDVSILEDDRVTPFDRWLGIDVRSEDSKKEQYAIPEDFVDSMDEANYVVAHLPKPMGIVFEENDPSCGGVFVASLAEGGAASNHGNILPGDQLVAVGGTVCKGVDFDACLGYIQASTDDTTKLIFFRGGPNNFYGALGCSQEWLDQFMDKQRAAP